MSVPSFPDCSTCGDSSTPIQTVPVPYCGQQESTDACASQKGKFHDRLIDSFVVPKVGRQTKLHVCDARLWAKHQWVGISNGADKITVYPIMEIGNKTITILNGCRSGEEIFGNAEPGKEFVEGTVIYPVPPQGCDSNFCERIADALRTCGADAVLEVLRTSDEICFTNVPELEETERGHVFVGTMPDPCNCPEEYGFGEGVGGVNQDPDNLWRSCLRKLTKIFTNLGGKTFCFSDMPLYNKLSDPDRVATTVVLNQKGCLSKGSRISADCTELESVNELGADAIKVCSDGEEKLLIPECGTEIVGCCDDEGLNPKWIVRKRGWDSLDDIDEIYSLSGGAVTNGLILDFDLTPVYEEKSKCRGFAIIAYEIAVASTTGAAATLYLEYFFNETVTIDFGNAIAGGGGDNITSRGVTKVPILSNNKIKFKITDSFPSTRSVKIKLLAFE